MKKLLLFTLLACILLALAYFGYKTYQKVASQKIVSQQVKHLTKPSVFSWIGKQAPTNQSPTIILFFHPECEHCQYEAKAILKEQKAFAGINLWWISIADNTSIQTFAKTTELSNLTNNYFAHLLAEKVPTTFGSVSVPHIFIYDAKQTLQKEFKGETKVEALLKYSTLSPNEGIK